MRARTHRQPNAQALPARQRQPPDAALPWLVQRAGTLERAEAAFSPLDRSHDRPDRRRLDASASKLASRHPDICCHLGTTAFCNPALHGPHEILLFLQRQAIDGFNRPRECLHDFSQHSGQRSRKGDSPRGRSRSPTRTRPQAPSQSGPCSWRKRLKRAPCSLRPPVQSSDPFRSFTGDRGGRRDRSSDPWPARRHGGTGVRAPNPSALRVVASSRLTPASVFSVPSCKMPNRIDPLHRR